MRAGRSVTVAARAAAASVLLVGLPAAAHHSYAMFDMHRELSLEGTVRAFQWTNPHIWIDIVVNDKATGKAENWSIEGKGPVQLVGDGWKRDSVKPGDHVSLVIHPLKQGTHGGSLLKIQVNGREIGAPARDAAR